jgi:pimeloyl-ACP methyl ester carboxylesterase
MQALWWPIARALQADLATLTPDGRLIVADESGHFIDQDQPQLVIDAISDVVEAVRDPSTWAAAAATPTS